MLNVIFGKIPDVIYNTSLYFKNTYEKEWLLSEDVQRMIEDVDSSKVLSSSAIDSPVLGIIPPTSLSGGVKTLILIDKVPDKLFNASNCCDKCAKWLIEMGRKKDITINLRHMMDFGDGDFELKILNTGEIVHNMEQLDIAAGRFV